MSITESAEVEKSAVPALSGTTPRRFAGAAAPSSNLMAPLGTNNVPTRFGAIATFTTTGLTASCLCGNLRDPLDCAWNATPPAPRRKNGPDQNTWYFKQISLCLTPGTR